MELRSAKSSPSRTDKPKPFDGRLSKRGLFPRRLLVGAMLSVNVMLFCSASFAEQTTAAPTQSERKLILAHYMPWYVAKPFSPVWGWHWTMNAFDPDKRESNHHQLATHYTPIIGPYDSGDPVVLEYHLLTMKAAGIDGVIVDWYGLENFRDYQVLHRNTVRLVESLQRFGLKFAICYEDQSIPALVEAKRLASTDRVKHAVNEIDWMRRNWFRLDSYARIGDRPILLSFGQTGLTDEEWSTCFKQTEMPIAYFSLHHRRQAAIGAFDWPIPSDADRALDRFQKESRNWTDSVPIVFPRFVDIYAEAKVGTSYGRVEDDGCARFRRLLEMSLRSSASIIQVATWNDWGEGTIIEPSREFGYRDLDVIRERRREQNLETVAPETADLRLPLLLYERRRTASSPHDTKRLDEISQLIVVGNGMKLAND